jgi:L-asparagine transporter-like permease
MQDADLFLELAGIAGVFVGFGALIAVRSGGASGRVEVGYTRGMVTFGVLAVVAALAPVTLGRYDLTEHGVWALSSAVVLAGWLVFIAINLRTPEYRANLAEAHDATRSRWVVVGDWATTGLYVLVAVLAPIVIVLGLLPDLEAALYFTVVVAILLGAAWLLLALVFSQRSGQTASDPAALSAPERSST